MCHKLYLLPIWQSCLPNRRLSIGVHVNTTKSRIHTYTLNKKYRNITSIFSENVQTPKWLSDWSVKFVSRNVRWSSWFLIWQNIWAAKILCRQNRRFCFPTLGLAGYSLLPVGVAGCWKMKIKTARFCHNVNCRQSYYPFLLMPTF